ncbi:MAG: hypothetical protein R6W90_07885 [Ignavibacteriaceae bacterium]
MKNIIVFLMLFNTLIFSQNLSLNGEWQFAVDSKASFKIDNVESQADWRKAEVPLSWQAQFEDLREYRGVAWYKKTFILNEIEKDKAYMIHFGAVDYLSRIYINGNYTGEHEGGYTPFEVDITENIRAGENEIVVRVMDPAADETGTEGISYFNIPHGKQNWYVQTSGIWQAVQLKIKPALYTKKFHLTPSVNGEIDIAVILNKETAGQKQLKLSISDPSGNEVLTASEIIPSNKNSFSFKTKLSSPKLWSVETPHLYTARITIDKDIAEEKFGFRSFEAKNKMLYLNGEPFYLIAALDQDFYPETIYTTPSEEYIRDEMIKAKQLGLNMLRCHIKVPDPVYLKVADEVGLLVWYEIPNWDVFTFDAAKRGEQTLDEMLARDWNHPSLVVLSIINESWGIDLQKEEQRLWLLDAFTRTKEKAAGRLVVDNSACYGNFHLKTDLNDYHTYWAIPEHRDNFDETVNEVASRPDWLFSKFGDAQQSGDEPLLISEFGNWGLPKLPEELPWWFNRAFSDIEVSLPDGVQKRFKDYKYDEIFGTYDNLAEESQHAQYTSLKYEIESIRLHNEIQGYVITEFTDLNWESNGLLDMWRNFKVYSNDITNIQQQDIIIPRPLKYNYSAGETAAVKLWISHYSSIPFENLILKWTSKKNDSGNLHISSVKRTEVKELDIVNIKLSPGSYKEVINFELTDSKGRILAKNYCEIFVYSEINNTGRDDVTITNQLNDETLKELKNGGSVICIIDSTTAAPASFPFKFVSRKADWLDGNWASNFNWARINKEPFSSFNFGKHLGFEISGLKPGYVITGIPAENFSDVLAGMFVGWVHMNSGYIVQMKADEGRLILCTLSSDQAIGQDPYSSGLLNKLTEYIRSENFKPNLSWKL